MKKKITRLAILTGGGDVPGLNSAMKQVIHRAEKAGIEVFGFTRGWAGLAHYQPGLGLEGNREWVRPLTYADVRTIDRYGGTFLHTSRTNPAKVRESDMPEHLKQDGITYPAEGILARAKEMGLRPIFSELCCALLG